MGKSTLLTALTGTKSEAAAYEFTTLTCIPGVIHYNDAKIQLLDLPGIIEGAAEGKGVPNILQPYHRDIDVMFTEMTAFCVIPLPHGRSNVYSKNVICMPKTCTTEPGSTVNNPAYFVPLLTQ